MSENNFWINFWGPLKRITILIPEATQQNDAIHYGVTNIKTTKCGTKRPNLTNMSPRQQQQQQQQSSDALPHKTSEEIFSPRETYNGPFWNSLAKFYARLDENMNPVRSLRKRNSRETSTDSPYPYENETTTLGEKPVDKSWHIVETMYPDMKLLEKKYQ